MKISVITSPFGELPPRGLGAVEKLWYDLGREFSCHGHEVQIIAKADMQSTTRNTERIKISPVSGYGRTGNIWGDILLDFCYSAKALRKVNSPDVLILNTFAAPILIRFFGTKASKVVYNVQRFRKLIFGFTRGWIISFVYQHLCLKL